jgi:hypothetical protein
MKTRKCLDCNGTGKIKVETYREPANMEAEEQKVVKPIPKRDWSRVKSGLKKAILPAIWIAVLAGFIVIGVHSVKTHQREMEEETYRYNTKWADKMGYVIAQYDEHGNNTRCWVVEPLTVDNFGKHQPTGPKYPLQNMPNIKWVEVPDRNDVNGFAHTLMIEDASKCIR